MKTWIRPDETFAMKKGAMQSNGSSEVLRKIWIRPWYVTVKNAFLYMKLEFQTMLQIRQCTVDRPGQEGHS